MGTSKTILTILTSIILTIILVSLVNIGTSIFLEQPNYEKYRTPEVVCTEDKIDCMPYYDSVEYENIMMDYNQIRFYIFAGIGFVLLILALFSPILSFIQLTGFTTGSILLIEGIVMNFKNKWAVFLSLIFILIVFGTFAWRTIKKL